MYNPVMRESGHNFEFSPTELPVEPGADTANIRELERLFAFRDAADVLEFLAGNPFLSHLLAESYDAIERYFPGSRLCLEVVNDPESSSDRQLVLFILTSLPPQEAMTALSELDRDWWLDALEAAQGKLCVTLEFH
jgi:hypothetical protein